MGSPPSPETIYQRSIEEGRRRLSMSPLDKVATGFIDAVIVDENGRSVVRSSSQREGPDRASTRE